MTSGSSLQHILIVDDEPAIRRFLRTSLTAQGFQVVEAQDGKSALEELRRQHIDLLVLDLGLPDMDGFEIINQLRHSGSTVPILVLSSRTDEGGKVKAFDLGADDYVTKPFGVEEFLARVRAALRHKMQSQGENPVFHSGDLSVDLVRRIVTVGGRDVKLSRREYDLLRMLVLNAGKVVTHKSLLKEIWGSEADIQYLRIYIRALRNKIEADPERPQHIQTEQGVGYRLRSQD
jgi:two-component system KDP operon response regulator KdpE